MDLVVIKFGGSSLSNNEDLNQVVQKTISFIEKGKRVVVILSAQGNTTDNLLEQARELNLNPNKRELDMLLSVGEQIACSKFAILLHTLGYQAVSLNGWQAGIMTDSDYTEAKIKDIHPIRIWEELDKNQVVVVTGFQGIDELGNITTLGRNGSDTTAVAIAAALEQKECYIFKDINGVYDKNPKEFADAKRIDSLSYKEMDKIIQNGSNVLHDRCVKIAEKYKIKIIVSCSFNEEQGSIIE